MFMFSFSAKAEILVDESLINPPSGISVGASLGLSKVEYEYSRGDWEFAISRKTLGLGLVSSLGSGANLLLQAGYVFKSEYEDTDWEGKGWMLGGGVNFLLHKGSRVSVLGYGLLNYTQEEYEYHEKLDADLTLTDLHLGALFMFRAGPRAVLYVGPDFVPYSEGEIKFSDKHRGEDFEREDVLNLKIGASIAAGSVVIRPEVTLMNEQTLMLTVDF
jgi:hypothetical protein